MSRGGQPPAQRSARLFVALELPREVVDALLAWRAPLLREDHAPPALRPVRRESLHVTLCFLGQVAEETVAPLSDAVSFAGAQARSVPGLSLVEGLWLPRRRPRVLAVALADRDAALARLQRSLSERLAAGGWYEP
ncbi:MAG TPA: 2'-5' RNA ligase family protein, partial [Conexibacter sp.]|nr:2'-5' RNA ligase family protein [Conexibacter sp.]